VGSLSRRPEAEEEKCTARAKARDGLRRHPTTAEKQLDFQRFRGQKKFSGRVVDVFPDHQDGDGGGADPAKNTCFFGKKPEIMKRTDGQIV
jgi:hypothetical protein